RSAAERKPERRDDAAVCKFHDILLWWWSFLQRIGRVPVDRRRSSLVTTCIIGRMSLPRVSIVGCGFAGLWAAQALGRAALEVTVIDRTNHHLFTPLLYQVATAGLSAPSIAAPIRHILAGQKNTTVLFGEVTGIDPGRRVLRLENGDEAPYDYLVLAAGTTHSYFGHDDWAAYAP